MPIEEWKLELVKQLARVLLENAVHEGDWEDGYTENDVETVLPVVNQFLSDNGFEGKLVIVWNEYSDGAFDGDSELYFYFPLLSPTSPTNNVAYPVAYPLFENGIQNFIDNILSILSGSFSGEFFSPFSPVWIDGYRCNATWRAEGVPYYTSDGFTLTSETDIAFTHQNVRVSFEDIGEGFDGDYNPENPDDKPLLRFDVSELVNGEWAHLETRCTQFPAMTTIEEKKSALKLIADRVLKAIDRGSGLRMICDEVSWIDPSWVQNQ